jgi:hypothetical protein
MDDCRCGYSTKVGEKKKTLVQLVSLSIFNLLNLMKDIVFEFIWFNKELNLEIENLQTQISLPLL